MQISPNDERKLVAQALLIRRRMLENDSRRVLWTWRRMTEKTAVIYKRSEANEKEN